MGHLLFVLHQVLINCTYYVLECVEISKGKFSCYTRLNSVYFCSPRLIQCVVWRWWDVFQFHIELKTSGLESHFKNGIINLFVRSTEFT